MHVTLEYWFKESPSALLLTFHLPPVSHPPSTVIYRWIVTAFPLFPFYHYRSTIAVQLILFFSFMRIYETRISNDDGGIRMGCLLIHDYERQTLIPLLYLSACKAKNSIHSLEKEKEEKNYNSSTLNLYC